MGCVNISNRLASSPNPTKDMKAHQASPRRCNEFCRQRQFSRALVSLKRCVCFIDTATSVYAFANDSCNERCKSNTSLICGGRNGVGSFYRTGTWAFFYAPFCSVVVFVVIGGLALVQPILSLLNACHTRVVRTERNYSKKWISCGVGNCTLEQSICWSERDLIPAPNQPGTRPRLGYVYSHSLNLNVVYHIRERVNGCYYSYQ